MEWVLLVSLQWVVFGSPTNPTTEQIAPFATEELCKKAAEKIKAEVNNAALAQRVVTYAHTVCFARKEQ